MSLSQLLCRSPVSPLRVGGLLDRVSSRKVAPTLQTKLPNGVQVLTAKGFSQHAHIGVYAKAGSRTDFHRKPGLASFTQRCLQNALYSSGNYSADGATDRELSYVTLSVPSSDAATAVKTLGDAVKNFNQSPDALNKVKTSLHNEIAASRSNIEFVLFDNLVNAAFESTDLGCTPLPTDQAAVAALGRPDVEEQLDLFWNPSNLIVVAVGNVNHDEIVNAAQKQFSGVSKAVTHHEHTQPRFLGGDINQWNHSVPYVHLAYGMECPALTHEDSLMMQVLPELFGSYNWDMGQYTGDTMISRYLAFQPWVRELQSYYLGFSDAGIFGFYFKSDVAKWRDWLQKSPARALFGELVRLQFQMLPEEFQNAKTRALTKMFLQSGNSPKSYSLEIAKHASMHGRHIPIAEVCSRLEMLDMETAMKEYHEYFYDRTIVASGFGYLVDPLDSYWLRASTWTYQV